MTKAFPSRGEARAARWFSRRHETREAHDAAVAKYKAASARHRAKSARPAVAS